MARIIPIHNKTTDYPELFIASNVDPDAASRVAAAKGGAVGCDIENVDNIITLSTLGWLPCDGSSVSKTKYSALYAVIGNIDGSGSTDLNFKLPDLRGYFTNTSKKRAKKTKI
ncbi:MAG: hypothetical protein QG657_1446 [Acidobacteriota bacterium]|nr:hypothetical protein [Acidobacteriota bacterium]